MAKRNSNNTSSKTSRKEVLLSRRDARRFRKLRLILIAIFSVIGLLLLAGVVVEYGIMPSRPVAEVNGEKITLREWQKRVRLERDNLVATVEQFNELVQGDINQMQQFAGQQLQLLQSPDILGQQVLNQMIDETLVRQEAEKLGVTVSQSEIDDMIGERFGFYGGGLPTPLPDPTETPVPTPSITPIVISDGAIVEPTVAAATESAPISTPRPTSTAVSAESYDTQLSDELARIKSSGSDETTYRSVAEIQILGEKLATKFQETQGLPTEIAQVSLLYMEFADEAAANEAAAIAGNEGFLQAWNILRSTATVEGTAPTSFSRELSWVSAETLVTRLGQVVSDLAFGIDVDTTSGVIASDNGSGEKFYIFQLRGRETRPLSETDIERGGRQALNDWLNEARISEGIIIFDIWENRVPKRPDFDISQLVRPEPEAAAPVPSQ